MLDTKIYLSHVEFMPEADSLNCLYTKVALTASLLTFRIGGKQTHYSSTKGQLWKESERTIGVSEHLC